MSTTTYYGNGKLLISGEYAVLDGALALALPTKFGQSLQITSNNSGVLHWESYDADRSCWLQAIFSLSSFEIRSTTHPDAAKRLHEIFIAIREEKPDFLKEEKGIQAITQLSFHRNWGLGTSSTLIYTLAQWASVDPYQLLSKTFGGSGYDVACAGSSSALLFHLQHGTPVVERIEFSPGFRDQLFFVYLNQKQSSQSAIIAYRSKSFDKAALISRITQLTRKMITAPSLQEFEANITMHELIMSGILEQETIKMAQFPDYFGSIKSLGAWGGDFVLATGNEKTPDYFKARGFPIVLTYQEMILTS